MDIEMSQFWASTLARGAIMRKQAFAFCASARCMVLPFVSLSILLILLIL